jgi:hypothetical protein
MQPELKPPCSAHCTAAQTISRTFPQCAVARSSVQAEPLLYSDSQCGSILRFWKHSLCRSTSCCIRLPSTRTGSA